MNSSNIATALIMTAARAPYRPALICPAGRDRSGRARFTQYNFAQLNELVDGYAHGLSDYGLGPGERVLTLIRPGVDLVAVAFALFKIGAVPVFIDPGMGRQAFIQCVTETEPTSFIGIPAARLLRR
ncbi:MAG TPA: AMP-binding protein, partial [Anaerolineae bacterium]|nr:AMP-binding protein [Anaerolineae bacterium]